MLPIRAAAPNIPDFAPVPRRSRSDGWTDDRQRAFIAMLAATGSVAVACDSVGLHISGAYKLRGEPGGASFVRAWNEALDAGVTALKTVAFDRAVNGVPVTLFYQGEPQATTTRHDNRLLMSLLRHYDRPGTAAAAPGQAREASTDTATIMWLCSIREIKRHHMTHVVQTQVLSFLLKMRRHPYGLEVALDQAIYGVTSVLRTAGVSLDHHLVLANEGPEGARQEAAGVTHTLKPLELTLSEQASADQVLAYLRGQGPPLSIERLPMPEGAPDIRVDPIPRRP